MSEDLVSVIIPTYYRNDLLESCISSVLDQNYGNLEIIVVDDSGEEHARSVCKSYDVQYVPKENEGPQVARELGFEMSSGEYIQFLDDDDELSESKISSQVRVLESQDDCGVAYCGFRTIDGDVQLPKKAIRGDVLQDALTFNMTPCVTSTMLLKREILERIHPFNHYRGATDVAMKIKLASVTNFEFIDSDLVVKRESDDSLGRSLESVNGRWNIVRDFEGLYEQVDDRFRQKAIERAYQHEAKYYLDESGWSVRSIVCFTKACYHSPNYNKNNIGAIIMSLFGSRVWNFARKINNRIDNL